MQIIFVHPKLKQAKTLTFTRKHLAIGLGAVFFVFSLSSGLLSYAAVNFALHTRIPQVQTWVQNIVRFSNTQEVANKDQFFRQNLDALATKLGQLQAQISHIDAIGERVAKMTGIKPSDLPKPTPTPAVPSSQLKASSGGPYLPLPLPMPLAILDAVRAGGSIDVMTQTIHQISRSLDERAEYLAMVESEMLMQSVRTKLLPTNQPLSDGFMGSRFGYRSDPFNGRSAMHEGIDFNAPSGTPILAAGGGRVVTAGPHISYGNHIDLDHGGGLITRYAHASKLHVKVGDIVKQGQKIAEVGSTGRSTGAHLHFEVRVDEVAQDPLKFLQGDFNFSTQYAKK